jgi:hypothetical protein
MDIDLPEEDGGVDVEVSDDDLDFVQQYGSKIGFLENLDKSALDKCVGLGAHAWAAATRMHRHAPPCTSTA